MTLTECATDIVQFARDPVALQRHSQLRVLATFTGERLGQRFELARTDAGEADRPTGRPRPADQENRERRVVRAERLRDPQPQHHHAKARHGAPHVRVRGDRVPRDQDTRRRGQSLR